MLPVENRVSASRVSSIPAAGFEPAVAKAQAAVPAPPGQSNKAYDGFLVGGDGNAYPPGTALDQVPPTRPSSGKGQGTLVFVNGVGESRAGNKSHLQEIANGTGMNVVGLYNASEGHLKDLLQAVGDVFDLGTNKAVDSLADMVYSKISAGEPVRVMAHSQGAVITARALEDVKNRLMLEDGLTKAEAEAKLSKVGVETFGGAGLGFTDGPRYVHYVNRADIVPMGFGVGNPIAHAGKGAKVVKFGWPNPFGMFTGAHSTSTYFKHYQKFPA